MPAVDTRDVADIDATSLPPVKLSMHMWDESPSRRFVILDGQRMAEGDRNGEVTVVSIERDGVIEGYYARLNPQALKAGLLVFVEISLAYKSGDIFEEFRRAALKLPNVLECHLMSGDFDYLIKARISEMASYRKLLGSSLLTLPHVRESKSYIVMEEVKETLALAVPD